MGTVEDVSVNKVISVKIEDEFIVIDESESTETIDSSPIYWTPTTDNILTLQLKSEVQSMPIEQLVDVMPPKTTENMVLSRFESEVQSMPMEVITNDSTTTNNIDYIDMDNTNVTLSTPISMSDEEINNGLPVAEAAVHYKVEELLVEILSDINEIDNTYAEADEMVPNPKLNIINHQLKTQPKPFKCIGNGCKRLFNQHNKEEYRQHKRMPHKCPICKMMSANVVQLYHHNRRVHTKDGKKKDPVSCDLCNKMFTKVSNLQRHKKHVHDKVKDYQCDICKTFFGRIENLQVHMNTHITERPYECTECTNKFKSEMRLRVHKRYGRCIDGQRRQRRGRQRLKQINGRGSTNTELKQMHKDRLARKTDIICELCGQTFKTRYPFSVHMRKHNNDRPFACEHCDKTFLSKYHLGNHALTHTGEKRFNCSLCDSKFAFKGQLTIHMLTHTGERPHKCKLCESAFAQTSHLRYHMLTHSGEKRYSCSVCDKRFMTRSNLRIHVRLHTGERPYQCTSCGGNFVSRGAMNKHRCRTDVKLPNQ